MPHYVGLDVSQKTTSICVVDEQGRQLWRGVCTTHPDPIATRVLRHAGGDSKIGIETGSHLVARIGRLASGAGRRRKAAPPLIPGPLPCRSKPTATAGITF